MGTRRVSRLLLIQTCFGTEEICPEVNSCRLAKNHTRVYNCDYFHVSTNTTVTVLCMHKVYIVLMYLGKCITAAHYCLKLQNTHSLRVLFIIASIVARYNI